MEQNFKQDIIDSFNKCIELRDAAFSKQEPAPWIAMHIAVLDNVEDRNAAVEVLAIPPSSFEHKRDYFMEALNAKGEYIKSDSKAWVANIFSCDLIDLGLAIARAGSKLIDSVNGEQGDQKF
jgi:hypothetical protein